MQWPQKDGCQWPTCIWQTNEVKFCHRCGDFPLPRDLCRGSITTKTHSRYCSSRHGGSSFIPQVLIFLFLPCLITFFQKKEKNPDFTSALPCVDAEAPMRNDGVIYRTLCSTLRLIQSDFFPSERLANRQVSFPAARGSGLRLQRRAWWKRPRLNLFHCPYRGINS